MSTQHAIESTNLADLLERVLDKGIVIAGDVKIKLVDIELLTLQIRLVICSVDKAKEMGIDWWTNNPTLCAQPNQEALPTSTTSINNLESRLEKLEKSLAE